MRPLLFFCLLLAGCRLYDSQPIDCRISCGPEGQCPADTTCEDDGFCRLRGAKTLCECRAGEERACGSSVGTCVQGVQRCAGTEWGACEDAVGERAELCNGLDDDCDGMVDDDISLPPPCARTIGVCANTRQQCVDGAWRACDDFAYGPNFELEEVSCDELDNDCDGLVDSHAVVQLAPQLGGRWSFLTTTRGFALINETQAIWLSRRFEVEFIRPWTAGDSLTTSRGDTLVLAQRTDAGVSFTSLERDGGVSDLLINTWLDPTALRVSVDVAAAIVNGQVELVSLIDGGAPISPGPDTDGTLSLSQTGAALAWSGGVVRTDNLGTLRSGSVGPLLALVDLGSNTLAGVPALQSGEPVFSSDLLAGRPVQPVSMSPVPQLRDLQATELQGRLLLVGIEGADALWVVTERGTRRRLLGSLIEAVRTTPSHETMAAYAWQEGGTISAVRRCTP